MARELVTIRKAMELTKVSRGTIYKWRADGKIRFVRTAGGAVRIYADTLFTVPLATTSLLEAIGAATQALS